MDPLLLEILACPGCDDRPPLRLQGDNLVCEACRRAYPIVDGIPQVILEAAVSLDEVEAGTKETQP